MPGKGAGMNRPGRFCVRRPARFIDKEAVLSTIWSCGQED
jgi:hypothetical protein